MIQHLGFVTIVLYLSHHRMIIPFDTAHKMDKIGLDVAMCYVANAFGTDIMHIILEYIGIESDQRKQSFFPRKTSFPPRKHAYIPYVSISNI